MNLDQEVLAKGRHGREGKCPTVVDGAEVRHEHQLFSDGHLTVVDSPETDTHRKILKHAL